MVVVLEANLLYNDNMGKQHSFQKNLENFFKIYS
jgi:hypothetical protein